MTLSSLTKRLIVTAVAAVLLSATVFSVSAIPASSPNEVGNVNGDTEVDVNDATYLQKILAGIEAEPENFQGVANAYSDGKVDIKDATAIQLYSAKIIDALPMIPGGVPVVTTPPTEAPTQIPTDEPTEASTQVPTSEPAEAPTDEPTQAPTSEPTEAPTQAPTSEPTESPTQAPTEAGTDENGWGNGIFRPFSL